MADKSLRKLSRAELLEMLLEQSKEVELLKIQNQKLKERLENRRIMVEESGSIAEAALKLNGIFETAQKAADQYLENVKQSYGFRGDGGDIDNEEER